jgi:hypothetical protein
MEKNMKVGMIFGFFIGAIVSGVLVSTPPIQQLRECQKELPRNQMCELIAVPMQEN